MRPVLKRILWAIRATRSPLIQRWMVRHATAADVTSRRAVVVAPHHDDETFGCGGVIALKRRMNVPVSVVFVSDGRASHGAITGARLDELLETRRREALRACEILGVAADDVHFLNHPDGRLRHLDPAERRTAVTELADLFRRAGAEEVYVPRYNDRHPDHEATWRLTRDGIAQSGLAPAVFEYPIWLVWLSPLRCVFKLHEFGGNVRVDVSPVQDLKNRAIDVYRTQLGVLPRGFVRQFTNGVELYFPGAAPPDADADADAPDAAPAAAAVAR